MIRVSIDSNEAMRPRAELIRKAIETDDRFELSDDRFETPFDLRVWTKCDSIREENFGPMYEYGEYMGDILKTFPEEVTKTLHIEIKDFTGQSNSDYVNSIINGHGWEQCQAAMEIGEPFIIAVLGDDHDIQAAIRKAAGHGEKGKRGAFDIKKFEQYSALVDGFEANCIGENIQIWKLGYNQFPRLLLRARKILEGGDLSGFCPKPAEKERMEVGLSIVAGRGVGPKMARNILERYQLCLILRDGYCGDLEDCEGIGPKRAETIQKNIEVMD